MTGPEVTPEDGVTRYAHDRTQGPACAIAAGAATVYRNYCVPVGDGTGQTRDRQNDCLRDLGAALSSGGAVPWTMRNGYALCSRAELESVNAQLRACDELALDALRSRLRIGIQWNTQVTAGKAPLEQIRERPEWIHNAIRRALRLFARSALDVRLVSYRTRSDALEELARR